MFDLHWLQLNASRVVGGIQPATLTGRTVGLDGVDPLAGETEEEAQRRVFDWAELAVVRGVRVHDHLFHVPNGEARAKGTAGRLHAMGVRKGVPDLLMLYPAGPYHGLALEMKRRRGGSVTPEQDERLGCLTVLGYAACLAHGSADGIDCVAAYLGAGDLDRHLYRSPHR